MRKRSTAALAEIERRLAALEARRRERNRPREKPFAYFETSRDDPTLFRGPAGALFTEAEIDTYCEENNCRAFVVNLDRRWPPAYDDDGDDDDAGEKPKLVTIT